MTTEWKDCSGSLPKGGTAFTISNENKNRIGFMFQNLSNEPLWISELALTAVMGSPSFRIGPNEIFVSSELGFGTKAITVIGRTTGQAWTAREAQSA